jgi:hypothetical protein
MLQMIFVAVVPVANTFFIWCGKSPTGTPPVDDGKDWICLIKRI